jgi:hypothetical protein
MKFKNIALLPLLAALALCGCQGVSSKTPVGGRAAALKPEEWNGKWQDGDGGITRTRIKDATLGVVEFTPVKPAAKPGQPKSVEIVVRGLGGDTVANAKLDPKSGLYSFGRVAITASHIVIFPPDVVVFADLVKRGKLAGTPEKDKAGKPTGSLLLEGFTGEDYERLLKAGVDGRSLFDQDPVIVMVRVK